VELGPAGLLVDADVSAARLGALLHAARRASGLRRKEVAARAEVRTRDLRAWERGEADVPDEALARLAGLYGSALEDLVGVRVPLRVTTDRVVAGADEQAFDPTDRDAAFRAYAHLVLRLRGAAPGRPVPLRADDLAVLAVAVGSDPDEVAERVMAVLGCSRDEAVALHAAVLHRRVVLPAAGFALGAVALASVAFTAPPEPRATTPGASVPASVSHAGVDPTSPTARAEEPAAPTTQAEPEADAATDAATDEVPVPAPAPPHGEGEAPPADPEGPGRGPVVSVPEGEVFIEIGEPLVVEAPDVPAPDGGETAAP
jgi:transcriptional regulator with XRE-family HTH domain